MSLRALPFLIALAVAVQARAMDLHDTFNLITTPVEASVVQPQTADPKGLVVRQQSQGTAFFYQRLAPRKDPTNKGPQWRAVEDTWLITNRHVVLPKIGEKEVVPNTFTFHMRKNVGDRLEWEPVVLPKDQLLQRARFHSDATVDVAVIHVHDLLADRFKQKGAQYLQHYPVSREDLPDEKEIDIQASDDVIVVGYPRGFYDEVNLFPIVKAGIVASRWGASFNGRPYFLIDAKLFPGSSGSIVISKPMDVAVRGGQLSYSEEKQFAFLGIYSGEPFREGRTIEAGDLVIQQKLGFDVGIVWYGSLVQDIIDKGVEFKP